MKFSTGIEALADFVKRMSGEPAPFPNNEWLYAADMEVYVRRSMPRLLRHSPPKFREDGIKCITLDIANINIYKTGQGTFTRFLDAAHAMNPWGATYVESVLSGRLGQFLLRQNYLYQWDSLPPSYYKLKQMKVWLDDLREMPKDFTHWAKTADEAIDFLKTGQVEVISLDHDLGHSHSDGWEEEKTGYTVAKFIEEGAINGTLPELICLIHTQNVVGRQNIRMALHHAFQAWHA